MTQCVYLVDASRGTKSSEPVTIAGATTVLASSPSQSNYDNFHVTNNARMSYMDLWSEDDVMAARNWLGQHLTDSEVRQRFLEIGGIVRYIYRQEQAYNQFLMNRSNCEGTTKAVTNLILAVMRRAIPNVSWPGKETTNFHKLFGLVPSDDNATYCLRPLGSADLKLCNWVPVANFYKDRVYDYTKKGAGKSFESLAIGMFSLGVMFRARKLAASNSAGVGSQFVLFFPRQASIQYFAGSKWTIDDQTLEKGTTTDFATAYIPTNNSFPAVDSILCGVRYAVVDNYNPETIADAAKKAIEFPDQVTLQMTITDLANKNKHPIKVDELEDKVRSGQKHPDGKTHVMFVVPTEHYNSAVLQAYVKKIQKSSEAERSNGKPSTHATVPEIDWVEQWVVDCYPVTNLKGETWNWETMTTK